MCNHQTMEKEKDNIHASLNTGRIFFKQTNIGSQLESQQPLPQQQDCFSTNKNKIEEIEIIKTKEIQDDTGNGRNEILWKHFIIKEAWDRLSLVVTSVVIAIFGMIIIRSLVG